MHDQTLTGGFANAPTDAAFAFRAAMTAMARPGRIETLTGAQPPAPLSEAAGTLLLTLADPETPVFLAPSHDTRDLRDWLTFHTGAPLVGPGDCAFAVGNWSALMPLNRFAIGQAEYPDRSATLIVERPALDTTGHTLRGPGISDTHHLGLPATDPFVENAQLFPLGLDFFFTAGAQVAALPRTTRIEADPCT